MYKGNISRRKNDELTKWNAFDNKYARSGVKKQGKNNTNNSTISFVTKNTSNLQTQLTIIFKLINVPRTNTKILVENVVTPQHRQYIYRI